MARSLTNYSILPKLKIIATTTYYILFLRRACEQQVDLLQTIAQEKNIELSLTFDDNILL